MPELKDDISNCKSLMDGLDNMTRSVVSLRFASPIVGLSKVSRMDSERRVSQRGSSTERPLSIMRNYQSSREIVA